MEADSSTFEQSEYLNGVKEEDNKPNTDLSEDIENCKEQKDNDEKYDKDRIHITNLPKILGFKQFKKFLEKNLNGLKAKKVRQMRDNAYVSFDTPEEAQDAIKLLNGFEIKKTSLVVKLALTEQKKFTSTPQLSEEGKLPVIPKTARESVTPLADMPYEEQLNKKDQESGQLVQKLQNQLRKAHVSNVPKAKDVLRKIKPSPKIKEYRNKCEFTCGLTLERKICVGFVGGRYSKNQHYVIPIDDVDNITNQMKSIVAEFTDFVIESGLEPLDEAAKTGVWRLLTVREFGGDVMIIVSVFPFDDQKEKEMKQKLCDRFLQPSTLTEKNFRVTSIYWQSMEHCSDSPDYEHLAGAPYIYESLMDCRFQVSPSAFFQTNSQAASVLYSTIGEACGLERTSINAKPDEEPCCKKAKVENEMESTISTRNTVLMDICCGTGTIGQCLMKAYGNDDVCCVGIEMIASAVQDAKVNCKMNKISEERCQYIAGKAEDVFKNLKYHLPKGFSLTDSKVIGILDPPRAGLHEKVVLKCREMESINRLVFVSCDPNAAMKNIVDFCRPTSKKFDGKPFRIEYIQPVDMFPQTAHFEWIVVLVR